MLQYRPLYHFTAFISSSTSPEATAPAYVKCFQASEADEGGIMIAPLYTLVFGALDSSFADLVPIVERTLFTWQMQSFSTQRSLRSRRSVTGAFPPPHLTTRTLPCGPM